MTSKAAFIVLFSLMLLATLVIGRALSNSEPPQSLDQEYRKFDELVSFLRDRNAKQFAIDREKGIDEASFVTIGGIEQWVTIRGQNRNNPVLLFLHGGPGDPTHHWTFMMFAPWEKYFTVVQWDQRGAGRTLRKSGPSVAPTMTLDRIVQDGIELTEYLRKHLNKDKIIIVAHSFGTIYGLRMAHARPDLFYAYVGTGQASGDYLRNYTVAYRDLLKKARALGNQRALDELTRAGPPPYPSGEGFGVQRRWSNAFEHADQFLYSTLGLALVSPGNSVEDINDSGDGQLFSGEHLVPQSKSLIKTPKDLGLGLEFSIPMFVFQGAEDFTTPTELAREYVAMIQAPQKAFVPIKGGGHFAVFMKSDEFLEEMIKRVLPIATKR